MSKVKCVKGKSNPNLLHGRRDPCSLSHALQVGNQERERILQVWQKIILPNKSQVWNNLASFHSCKLSHKIKVRHWTRKSLQVVSLRPIEKGKFSHFHTVLKSWGSVVTSNLTVLFELLSFTWPSAKDLWFPTISLKFNSWCWYANILVWGTVDTGYSKKTQLF